MNTLIEILRFIVETLGGLFLLFVILRFFLQLVRADFYNPFSQAIVKITNPLLIPMRRIIPGVFGVDTASIVLAILVEVFVGEIIFFIATGSFVSPIQLFIWGILGILMMTTWVILICTLVLVVSSFVAPYSSHPILTLVRQLIDPILRPIQKLIPPMGGLDFSVFFAGMGIYILQMVLSGIASSLRLPAWAIIGF